MCKPVPYFKISKGVFTVKKVQMFVFILSMVLLFTGQSLAAYPDFYLNQAGVDFNLAPTTEAQMNYVPLQPLAQYYGMTLTVIESEKEVRGRWGKTEFILKFDTRLADINGRKEILDLPVINVNGHVLVPVNFMENLLKVEFRWKKPVIIIKENDYMNDIKISLYTNKEVYDFGEQIVATMIIKNVGSTKLRVPLSSSQVYDLTLTYRGHELWRWSRDKMFTTAITYFEMDPGESKVYTITLPRELILTPSQYQLQASFNCKPEIRSELFLFTIR